MSAGPGLSQLFLGEPAGTAPNCTVTATATVTVTVTLAQPLLARQLQLSELFYTIKSNQIKSIKQQETCRETWEENIVENSSGDSVEECKDW